MSDRVPLPCPDCGGLGLRKTTFPADHDYDCPDCGGAFYGPLTAGEGGSSPELQRMTPKQRLAAVIVKARLLGLGARYPNTLAILKQQYALAETKPLRRRAVIDNKNATQAEAWLRFMEAGGSAPDGPLYQKPANPAERWRRYLL